MPAVANDPQQPVAWQTLARRDIYNAPPFLRLSVERVRLPDGRVVEDFHTLDKPDYALVVPRLADGRILLLRQYKHGPRAVGLHPPGGHLAEGEPPLVAARRELLEETGYTADPWHHLGRFAVDANQGCGWAHFFLAENARPVANPGSGDLEDMQLVLLTAAQLRAAILAGEVNALGSIAALTLAMNSGPLPGAQST